MPRVTLQTIADRVGVSRMTVSNAFSRPDQLSPAMRRRILEAAEALGYAGPDPAARALARGSTGAIGVLLTESLSLAFTDEVATGFLGAVAAELAPTGLALTLLTTSSQQQDVIPARDVAIDGALIYSCDPSSAGTAWLARRKLPIVLVDQLPQPAFPSVNIDDRTGARAAAQHLVDLGHRRIGILSSSVTGPHGRITVPVPHPAPAPAPASDTAPAPAPASDTAPAAAPAPAPAPADNPVPTPDDAAHGSHVTLQRLTGWLDALNAAGIEPVVLQQPPYAPAAEAEAVAFLLDLPDPPTAVLCFSDAIAATVLRTAQDRGLRVPQDLSVVGFDDSPLAQRLRPALTTVRQDVVAKGRAAVVALTAEIARAAAGPEPGAGRSADVVLPTSLVIRDSTAAPPAG